MKGRKIFGIFLALALTLSVCVCGSAEGEAEISYQSQYETDFTDGIPTSTISSKITSLARIFAKGNKANDLAVDATGGKGNSLKLELQASQSTGDCYLYYRNRDGGTNTLSPAEWKIGEGEALHFRSSVKLNDTNFNQVQFLNKNTVGNSDSTLLAFVRTSESFVFNAAGGDVTVMSSFDTGVWYTVEYFLDMDTGYCKGSITNESTDEKNTFEGMTANFSPEDKRGGSLNRSTWRITRSSSTPNYSSASSILIDDVFVGETSKLEMPAELAVGKITFSRDSSPLTAVTPGTVTASVTVSANNGNSYDFLYIIGVYKGSRMVDMNVLKPTVSSADTPLEISEAIPDDGNLYTVRAFLWDKTSLQPVEISDVLEPANE